MFRFVPDTSYLMPAHFGGSPLSSWTYADVTTVGISYRTDGDALARYVPECFEITQPIVEIGYAMNRGHLHQLDNHPTLYPIDYKYTPAWRAAGTVDWQLLTWEQNPRRPTSSRPSVHCPSSRTSAALSRRAVR